MFEHGMGSTWFVVHLYRVIQKSKPTVQMYKHVFFTGGFWGPLYTFMM